MWVNTDITEVNSDSRNCELEALNDNCMKLAKLPVPLLHSIVICMSEQILQKKYTWNIECNCMKLVKCLMRLDYVIVICMSE